MINLKEKEFLNSAPAPKQPTKEELQIKKLKLQIEQLEDKKKQQEAKQIQQAKTNKLQATKNILKAIMILCGVLLAPLFILGGFLIACAKASGGTCKSKRY